MQQILITIPPGLPIYGYGMMLFLAFVLCSWLGIRLGRRVGIAPEVFKDLALWLFIFGILGARVFYFIFEAKEFPTPWKFIAIWDGGLIFYGSMFGGIVGFLVADFLMQRKFPYDRWKLFDCVAPCIALGLALGRIGCLLNGCCFGDVACAHCPAITFPIPSPPRYTMVDRGYQTTAGFTVERDKPRVVEFVEPGSAAAAAGLLAGDVIVKVNGVDIASDEALHYAFRAWPRGKNDLTLTAERPDGLKTLTFSPRTIGLHPSQIYETISMLLLLFFLTSYFPYRAADGILMVILMFAYGIHRFLNEMLRTDTEKVSFDMTLSQNISILVILGGFVLAIAVYRHAQSKASSTLASNAGFDSRPIVT